MPLRAPIVVLLARLTMTSLLLVLVSAADLNAQHASRRWPIATPAADASTHVLQEQGRHTRTGLIVGRGHAILMLRRPNSLDVAVSDPPAST